MSEAVESDPHSYPDFNSFFTRALKPQARTIASDPRAIISPVDGVVSQCGLIHEETLVQAKSFNFTVSDLFGGSIDRAAPFLNGHFATLYLSPKDYHRIHMPLAGMLTHMVHIPGRLFSVNPTTTQRVPQLFARNERVVCFFKTDIGPMAVVLVGAMICASISTTWHGVVTPPQSRKIREWHYEVPLPFQRGDEIGQFKLGSTVIVLFGRDAMQWNEMLKPDVSIHLGEVIGQIK